MDTSKPIASSPTEDATNRRRSGRTVKQPVLYQEDPNISIQTNGAPKRKRAQHVNSKNQNEDGSGNEDSDDDEVLSEEDEEVTELKKKAKKAPRKPATKKVKTAQTDGLTLAIRPAVNGVKKPSKPRPKKPRAKVTMPSGAEGTGLYGMQVRY